MKASKKSQRGSGRQQVAEFIVPVFLAKRDEQSGTPLDSTEAVSPWLWLGSCGPPQSGVTLASGRSFVSKAQSGAST